jgi:hypothetical protein
MALGDKKDPQGIFNIDLDEIGVRGEPAGKRQAVGKNKIEKETPEDTVVSALDLPAFSAPMEAMYARKKKPR